MSNRRIDAVRPETAPDMCSRRHALTRIRVGPYAMVLEGLEYVGTDGLLPHELVTQWISGRATAIFCASGLPSPLGPCNPAMTRYSNSAAIIGRANPS